MLRLDRRRPPRIDGDSYSIRFTPRKQRGNWSVVNVRRVGELTELGLMRPAGVAAFERRSDDRTAIYAYEQRTTAKLDAGQERRFKANPQAWKWFQAQPAGYRRTASYWVISAKRPETRERRLEQLIEDSAAGRTIRSLTPPSARGASGAGPA